MKDLEIKENAEHSIVLHAILSVHMQSKDQYDFHRNVLPSVLYNIIVIQSKSMRETETGEKGRLSGVNNHTYCLKIS